MGRSNPTGVELLSNPDRLLNAWGKANGRLPLWVEPVELRENRADDMLQVPHSHQRSNVRFRIQVRPLLDPAAIRLVDTVVNSRHKSAASSQVRITAGNNQMIGHARHAKRSRRKADNRSALSKMPSGDLLSGRIALQMKFVDPNAIRVVQVQGLPIENSAGLGLDRTDL